MQKTGFVIVKRGYYWRGVELRGYAMTLRDAYFFPTREQAEEWRVTLDADSVLEVP
jgi:hypothetical protein